MSRSVTSPGLRSAAPLQSTDVVRVKKGAGQNDREVKNERKQLYDCSENVPPIGLWV